jgi:EmrB/QacA subfamily drug resistance transporter
MALQTAAGGRPGARTFGAAATIIVTSAAAFMVALDNLVVTTALPSIREHLHAGLEGLEWTVNAYTLTFAVLLLPAAALGDRLGRRRVFLGGLALFTLASAAAALSTSAEMLIIARALQGIGGAAVMPLSLTLLSAAVPEHRRGAALGVWGAASGLAVALGPVVGGAVTEGASWEFIFWLNVPIGLILLPAARRMLAEQAGPTRHLDLPGLLLVSAGLFGIVFGIVRGNGHGWASSQVLGALTAGAGLIAAFLVRESRTATPMLPLRLFRSRAFSAVNLSALLMSFGMFGSVFLLSQFLQTAMGYSPLAAGLRTLPWTAMPVLVAPIAGPLSDRIGGKPLLATGLALQTAGLAWIAALLSSSVSYPALIPAFVLSGIGMGLFFVPVAAVVLGSVKFHEQGVASGANNSFRELGGTLGIAVLGSVFSAAGSFATPHAFVDGLRPALVVGTIVLGLGTVAALLIPNRRPVASEPISSGPISSLPISPRPIADIRPLPELSTI